MVLNESPCTDILSAGTKNSGVCREGAVSRSSTVSPRKFKGPRLSQDIYSLAALAKPRSNQPAVTIPLKF